MAVAEGVGKKFVHKSLLGFQHGLLVVLLGHRPEEIVFGLDRVTVHDFGEAGFLECVGRVVLRIEGIDRPVLSIVVKGGPEFDLDDDVAFGREFEEGAEASPEFVVPLLQVVEDIYLSEGPDIPFVTTAHGAADVVAANRLQEVEVLLEIRDLEKVVLYGPSEQEDGFAFILPVVGIVLINLDSVMVHFRLLTS